MSFLKRLFGQSQESNPTDSTTVTSKYSAAKTEIELLEQYGGIALEKQVDVPAVLGKSSWQFDMNAGTISFGPELVFSVQILGTFSHSSKSWLWAWANEKSDIPESLKEQSLQLKEFGEANTISLLSAPQFDGEMNDVHLIGLVASGMFGASCYYIADYGQGSMLMTLKGPQFDQVKKIEHHQILTTFPQLISLFEINHKQAFTHYLQAKGYNNSEEGTSIIGKKDRTLITGVFDEKGRLIQLKG